MCVITCRGYSRREESGEGCVLGLLASLCVFLIQILEASAPSKFLPSTDHIWTSSRLAFSLAFPPLGQDLSKTRKPAYFFWGASASLFYCYPDLRLPSPSWAHGPQVLFPTPCSSSALKVQLWWEGEGSREHYMTQGSVTGVSSWGYLQLSREQLLEQTTLRVKWVIPITSGSREGGRTGKKL